MLDFARKSFTFFHFPDRTTGLLLALEASFWRATGTIVGTGFVDQSVHRRSTARLEELPRRVNYNLPP
jgi:hypothetical protein